MPNYTTSIVDGNRTIHKNQWVVSLVAKPRGKNPEHAILLVEGMIENQLIFRRYDYVIDGEIEGLQVQRQKGKVIIKEKECTLDASVEKRNATFWSDIMGDKDMNKGCQGLSWAIPVNYLNTLHEAVVASQKNPPDYQISGEHGIFAGSSSQSGHNCYTWACKLLIDLKHRDINHDDRLHNKLIDFLASRTTRHIAPEETKQGIGCTLL